MQKLNFLTDKSCRSSNISVNRQYILVKNDVGYLFHNMLHKLSCEHNPPYFRVNDFNLKVRSI